MNLKLKQKTMKDKKNKNNGKSVCAKDKLSLVCLLMTSDPRVVTCGYFTCLPGSELWHRKDRQPIKSKT